MIKQRAKDQFIQTWLSDMNTSNKATFYKTFKDELTIESYLDILPKALRIQITRFRCSNHRLPIETGRWVGINREQRKCSKCSLNCLGDEFHALLVCKHFRQVRKKHINQYYWSKPSAFKLVSLLRSSNKNTLINLAKFVTVIMRSHT